MSGVAIPGPGVPASSTGEPQGPSWSLKVVGESPAIPWSPTSLDHAPGADAPWALESGSTADEAPAAAQSASADVDASSTATRRWFERADMMGMELAVIRLREELSRLSPFPVSVRPPTLIEYTEDEEGSAAMVYMVAELVGATVEEADQVQDQLFDWMVERMSAEDLSRVSVMVVHRP